MVSVRRVKFIVLITLTFIGIIGLYNLEKRRRTLSTIGSFSKSEVKIPALQKNVPVTPLKYLTPLTGENEKRTEINSPTRSESKKTFKVLQIMPEETEETEETEEELINSEIDNTLEWINRMGQDRPKEERDSNKFDVVTDIRDNNGKSSVDEISTSTVKDERDLNKVTDLRDSNGSSSVHKISAYTVKDERDSNKVTDLRDSNGSSSVDETSASTVKDERDLSKVTDFRDSNGSSSVDEISASTLLSLTITEHARPTTHQSITIVNVQQSTQLERKNATAMYTPSPLPRVYSSCNLPNLDPWDPSIRHLLKDSGFNPGCTSRYPHSLYEVRENKIVLKDKSNINEIELNDLSLDTIHRTKHEDNDFYMNKEVSPINTSTDEVYESRKILESDFFRISYRRKGKEKETHYFARVVPRQDVIKKSKDLRQSGSKKGLPLNVLMLGIDSTSHANFVRKMPNTLDWLRNQVRSFVMNGYSIVGDATTPALTALLTGNHEYDLPEGRRGFSGSEPIDRWPWISKLYESHGYATLYGEDDPTMSTFNLRLNGFVTPPYHHFMRPFWLAIESEGLRDEPGICSREMSLVNYTMDYLLSFFEAYKQTPKFAMGFLSYLTHAHPNHLSFGDYDVKNMLTQMKSHGYLNNTLLVIFGDHGSRNNDVRNTMQGKLEERLPWLSISVPDWFESHYPELTAALANNENIIGSPFDLHTTLRHVLTFPHEPDVNTYRSFLTNMSLDRTCQQAGIDEHWCPCLQFQPIDVKGSNTKRAAQAVVDHINNRLNSSDILRMSCHTINLTAVHSAMQYNPNDKVQRFSSTNQDTDRAVSYGSRTQDDIHFLITIETSPMSALFEATVTLADDNNMVVNPNISRINVYGNQPKCIASKYPYLRKYCVCKT